MASYTGNLNLKKPALDDDALITDINNNMDILDAAVNGIQDGLAIVANGNTHVAITSGQFVYVRNHGTLTEGLYVASTNIAANATLSTSNLTADAAGGLNALNSKIENKGSHISCGTFANYDAWGSYRLFVPFVGASDRTIVVDHLYYQKGNNTVEVTSDLMSIDKFDLGFDVKCSNSAVAGCNGRVSFTVS